MNNIKEKTFLHLGCGPSRKQNTTPGFNTDAWTEVRMDLDPAVSPDVIGDMTALPFEAQSFDAIFCSHAIEHLYPQDAIVAMLEMSRVLKSDGFAIIVCPDLESACKWVSVGRIDDMVYPSLAGPITPLHLLYGYTPLLKDHPHMAHKTGFTAARLSKTLYDNGFQEAVVWKRNPVFELWGIALKEERPEDDVLALMAEYFPLPGA